MRQVRCYLRKKHLRLLKSNCKLDTSNTICCINQNEHIFMSNFINNASVFSAYSNGRISEILDNLDLRMLDNIKDKDNCKMLSGGEKQILSIVRMLSANTPICIMDYG